jgi:hypothetical protein
MAIDCASTSVGVHVGKGQPVELLLSPQLNRVKRPFKLEYMARWLDSRMEPENPSAVLDEFAI